MPVPSMSQIERRIAPAVERDLLRRGRIVKAAAQINLRGGGGAPRRVNSTRLLNSIEIWPGRRAAFVYSVAIGTRVSYAGYVIRGTGIYGPRRQPIRPRRAKVLRFYSKTAGRVVFARSVRGMRPNNFLVDALSSARG